MVTPKFDSSRHHPYTWTPLARFTNELEYLVRGFHILPLHEAIIRLKLGSLRGRCAALTLDDGDISIAEHVVPCLTQLGLPATFFINSAYLDCHQSYWFPILTYLQADGDPRHCSPLTKDLEKSALKLRSTDDFEFYNRVRTRIEGLGSLVPNLGSRLVSAQWLSSLDGEQFSIGAHGHEHQRFSLMPVQWQLDDLRKNINFLKSYRAYRPIFAVPFGRAHDWNNETVQIARAQGVDVVLADGGINNGPQELYRRIPSDNRSLRELLSEVMAA